MRGLIVKDLMCLRKQRITLGFVLGATLVLSIMFVLSSRYGNIYYANQGMIMENQMSVVDVKNLGTMVLILFMCLPIALVGDSATVFIYDGKAGFSNVSSILPLSLSKRLLAKYLTVLSMFGIGIGFDIAISLVLSFLTDIISFTDFLGIIISVASVMLIEAALTIFFCFLYGYGKESYAQLTPILLIGVPLLIWHANTIMNAQAATEELDFVTSITDFIKHKSYILFLISVFTLIISYLGSLEIIKRKRGMI